jgi:phenylpropionate dioxygenase-like ring-hydroxylating dioxygenase large terminal subunit
MTGLLDDAGVAERVLGHIDHKTTDVGDAVWREPVANYVSPERFEAERTLLRRLPVVFCPSAALAEPGAYVAHESAGVPLVAVRGEDGVVRAFRNACRHRGMAVAKGASGCAKAFVCGYHGWTYGLDGRLRFVPDEEGFPGLDKAAHGLAPVRADERGGLVFITQDPAADPEPFLADIPELIGPQNTLYSAREGVQDVNWKVSLEGFIEGYHIRATHPETFLPYGFDNLNLVEGFGANSRVTYPFKRINKLREVPPAERKVLGLVTFVYHLFPNALVTVLSSHTNVVILDPLAPDRVNNISYGMTNAAGEEAMARARRDSEFVGGGGVAEDRAVVAAIQRGLGSGANTHFTFGHFEKAIVHFHRNLDAALNG